MSQQSKKVRISVGGGIAYLYEPDQDNINTQMVYVERVTYDDKRILQFQISEHVRYDAKLALTTS